MDDDDTLDILRNIQSGVADLNRRMDSLIAVLDVQAGNVSALRREIGDIHTDVNRLQHDQAELAAGVGVLESEKQQPRVEAIDFDGTD